MTGTLEFGISDTATATAASVPVGASIGPMEEHKILGANVTMREPAIWAARYQQLDSQFIKAATTRDTTLPPTTLIKLDEDYTSRDHVRSSALKATTTESISWPNEWEEAFKLLDATAALLQIKEAEELPEDVEEASTAYWGNFSTAEEDMEEGLRNNAARAT